MLLALRPEATAADFAAVEQAFAALKRQSPEIIALEWGREKGEVFDV